MKVIRGIQQKPVHLLRPVVAIGVFDGLHRGHQALIRYVCRRARALRGTAVVITFFPHPVHVLHPKLNLPLVVSFPHRLKLMADLGVEVCIVMPFTKSFARLTPEQFIQKYLVEKIQPVEVVVGDDFRFGQDRRGTVMDFQSLGKKHGFKLKAIHANLRSGKKIISSTRIRELIKAGNIGQAQKLLGRRFSVQGIVVSGDKRGRKLGYPTANVRPQDHVILPMGVYLVRVYLGMKVIWGLANVGVRPSFRKLDAISLEVHLLNFHKNIYRHGIIVEFVKKIRDEKRFFTAEALLAQIRHDESVARRWLSRGKNFPSWLFS